MLACPPSIVPRWFPFVFIAVGLVALAVAGVAGGRTRTLLRESKSAVGTVERLERRQSQSKDSGRSASSLFYAPVFTFRDDQNKLHIVTSSVAEGGSSSYKLGQEVQVLYRPDDPSDARISSFLQIWLLPLLFGSLGVVLLIVGVVVRVKTK